MHKVAVLSCPAMGLSALVGLLGSVQQFGATGNICSYTPTGCGRCDGCNVHAHGKRILPVLLI